MAFGFGIVGCGMISQFHAKAIAEVRGAKLVACCDTRAESADRFAAANGCTAYHTLDELLADKGVDIVTIATPSGLHMTPALAAAKAGKHVIVEKPLEVTLKKCDRIIRQCAKNGVQLATVFPSRFHDSSVKLKRAIDGGRFGRLTVGDAYVKWYRTQQYYDSGEWRGTWALDGGVFANQASHHVDLLQWCLGEPTSVFARGCAALAKIETEDTGAAIITFANGALGIIEATTATRPVDLEGSLSILGEKGTVEIGGFAANKINTWRFEDPIAEDEEVVTRYRENPPNVYGYGHIAYLEHVLESVMNGAAALVDGLEGRKSLELITAIYESMATSQPIRIGFGERQSLLGRKSS